MDHQLNVPAFDREAAQRHDKILRTFRCLVADLCRQSNGGHPGGAMSMAAIGIALYRYIMVYSPLHPRFFNRDRISKYNVGITQVLSIRSTRLIVSPGSTQIQQEGIEVSTGALGQGVANAVGLAVAAKHLGATYNRPGHTLVDNMIWCTVGDACLQEGVALEAIQLADHWRLDNLAIIYNNNQITCCGSVDVTCSEDINAKMSACGWKVLDVFDGVSDVESLVQALANARANHEQPTFVNVRTIIAFGSSHQGHARTHGDALATEDVMDMKRRFGMDPEEYFKIDTDVYEFFGVAASKGKQYEKDFKQRVDAHAQLYPQLAAEFQLRMEGKMIDNW